MFQIFYFLFYLILLVIVMTNSTKVVFFGRKEYKSWFLLRECNKRSSRREGEEAYQLKKVEEEELCQLPEGASRALLKKSTWMLAPPWLSRNPKPEKKGREFRTVAEQQWGKVETFSVLSLCFNVIKTPTFHDNIKAYICLYMQILVTFVDLFATRED